MKVSRLQDHFIAEAAAPSAEQLEAMLASLSDGVDHPEIWQRLVELCADGEAGALMAALNAAWTVVPMQLVKPLQTVRAVVVAVIEDPALGLCLLKSLEVQAVMCPQLAGASVFVSGLGGPDRDGSRSHQRGHEAEPTIQRLAAAA